MATIEDGGAITWTVFCKTCQATVQEGGGTPPADLDLKTGSPCSRHVHEAGDVAHQLEIRRRGRVTESVTAVRAAIEF